MSGERSKDSQELLEDLFSANDLGMNYVSSQGDTSDNHKLQAFMGECGIEYVDITTNHSAFNALKYLPIPFLHDQRYLPRVLAKDILNNQIRRRTAEMNSYPRNYYSLNEYRSSVKAFIAANKL